MLNRPFDAVIVRLAIVAAALALLMVVAPAVFAATTLNYPENGMEAVATFSATDEDGDAIDWTLAGDDAADFEISDGGVLTFKDSPNYESPADKNLNNVYLVTVQASSGGQTATEDLEITVTDEDEPGKVTLSKPQPQVGRDLTATLSDVDAPVQDEKWQWSRGESADGPWTDIDKATSASRSPVAADDGMYLQATVTYEDKFGTGKTESAVTENSVESKTRANAAPSFAHLDNDDDSTNGAQVARAVDEGKKGVNVGKPVMARDGDNDVLLYTLDDEDITTDAVADGTVTAGTDSVDPTTRFSIDSRSGQIKTKVDSLNSDDDGVPGTSVSYTITVIATDPSGAPGRAMVTVTINDINDAPKIIEGTTGVGNRKALTVAENVDTSDAGDLDADPDTPAIDDPTYTATDDDDGDVITGGDNTATPPTANITYAVEGADKGVFRLIDDAGVQTLAFKTDHEVNYEKQKEYSISIVARDDSAPEGVGTLDVTVTVTNEEDTGKVELSQLEPQIGTAVIARLTDEDGGVRNPSWQWQRADAAQDTGECSALTTDATSDIGWTNIPGENSPSYAPTAADMADANNDDTADPRCLRAVVEYTDGYVTPDTNDATQDAGDSAAAVAKRDVQAENPANSAPKFEDDQDVNTPGDQADAERSVEENDSGANVGDPVTALPVDGDLLLYTLSGGDAGSFKVNRESGQITTAEKLDYETKDSYMVVVTATDPSGATDTINVNIEVLDVNDKPVISTDDSNDISYPENGMDPVAMFSATDEDGDPIEWSLAGDDAGDFKISDDGALEFKDSPNYESPADKNLNNVYLVTVQASSGGQTATEDLEITVTDEDEPGKVTLSKPQPQVGRDLTATLSDVDAPVQDEKWQWSRGESADGPWTDIDKATSASRSPVAADDGMYLQATVTYEDKFGTGKTESAVTENSVESKTRANAAPSFAHLDNDDDSTNGAQVARAVDEGKKGVNVGKPVMARDGDNDVLLYTLDAAGMMNNGVGGGETTVSNITSLFSIDSRSGQIKTKVDSLNSDDSGDTGATADANGEATYMITVTATDPSGAPGTATVTVTITDINDAPKITAVTTGTEGLNRKALTVVENTTDQPLDANTETGIQAPTFVATDDDAGDVNASDDDAATDIAPAAVRIKYSVEGADKGAFQLSSTTSESDTAGVTLSFKSDHTVNYEKQKEYSISIVARDDSAPEGVATLDVTVTVTNAEDAGKVELSQLEPQIGTAVIARLTDEDGNVRNPSWQWQRANAELTGDAACSSIVDDDWADIPGENSPSYTPMAADIPDDTPNNGIANENPRCLRAMVTYTDALDSDNNEDDTIDATDMDTADAIAVREVQRENPANSAPKFEDDQDVNTPGDQADAERSVEENDSGANVGDPVTALPVDGDLLMYTLSGGDAGSFKVNRESGQITTAEKLDYETKDMYMVVVTATDPSGATDTINVSISVLDVNDKPVITLGTGPAPEDPGDTCGMADAGSSLAADCRTLLGIMDDLVGDGPALNWSEDTSIADDWEGLAARSDRVKGIYLVNEGLAGVLPAGITALDALERLTLTDNDLTGEIPDLTGLDNIERLVLGGNAFTGGIPASLGNLDSLLRLWLHRNEGGFEGGIPAELGNLSNIRYLMLYGNGLTGEIPSELGNATNLKALYLHNNMLTGSIPAELGNLMTDADDTVRLLYLHNNMLSGDIPAELGNLTSLTALRLSGNMLTGCIPAAIADAAVDADRAGLMACAP